MSGNCVNIKSKEFLELQKQTDLTTFTLAAKVSLWQEKNGVENFPQYSDLFPTEINPNAPVLEEVEEVEEESTEENTEQDAEEVQEKLAPENDDSLSIDPNDFDGGYSNEASSLGNFLYGKRLYSAPMEKLNEIKKEVRQEVFDKLFPNGVPNTYDVVRDKEGVPREILVYPDRGRVKPESTFSVATERLDYINSQFLHPSYYKGYEGAKPITMGTIENRGDHHAIVLQPPFVLANILAITARKPYEVSKNNYRHLIDNVFLTYLAFEGILSPEQYANIYPNTEAHSKRYMSIEEIRDSAETYNDLRRNLRGETLIKAIDSISGLTVNERNTEDALFEEDMNITPQVVADPIRLESYIDRRKQQIKKVNLQITALNTTQKVHKTREQGKRLSQLIALAQTLEADLSRTVSGQAPVEIIREFFDKDFELLTNLLADASLDNIFLARDILDFLQTNRESITEEYAEAKKNNIFVSNTALPDEINKIMEKVSVEYNKHKINLENKTIDILMSLIEKYEDNLPKVFGTDDREIIKQRILKKLEDIDYISQLFRPQGSEVMGETDLLAQLIRNEYIMEQSKAYSAVAPIIQNINAILPELEAKLKELGFAIGSGINYQSLFFRDTPRGDVELVSLFSPKWKNFLKKTIKNVGESLREAYKAGDFQKVDDIYNGHYATMVKHSVFFDFRELPDIMFSGVFPSTGIVNDLFTKTPDLNYRDAVISALGQSEYDKLVAQQIAHLQNYEMEYNNIVALFLKAKNVTSEVDLLSQDKEELDFRLRRINPALFIQKHQEGKGNTTTLNVTGTLGKPSHGIKYVTFIPQRSDTRNKDFGYYDKNFETIKNDDTLYRAWGLFDDAVDTINSNYADSMLNLDARSMLFQAKSMAENAVDKSWFDRAKIIFSKEFLSNFKQFVKDAMSVKKKYTSDIDTVKVPGQTGSIKNLIDADYKVIKTVVDKIYASQGGTVSLSDNTFIDVSKFTADNLQELLQFLDLQTLQELQNGLEIGTETTFKIADLRKIIRNNVMARQTMNLPLLLKAQLEYSSAHKARVEAKKTVDNILSPLQKFEDENKDRARAKNKQDNFYQKVILNNKEEANGLIASNRPFLKEGMLTPKDKFRKLLSPRKHNRNLTPKEKRIMEVYLERLVQLEKLIPIMPTDESREALEQEKASIEAVAERMGKHYAISSIWNNLINSSLVYINMGLNPIVAFFNILQARQQIVLKAGVYFSVEATHKALTFVDGGWSRGMNKEYQKEWEKMAAFIQALNVIQDGTNELQRAERLNKATAPELFNKKNPIKFLTENFKNPMFFTQFAEYYNQAPTILASAYETITIQDPTTGKRVAIFDGRGFPYHEVVDGVFTLKKEFATPENIADAQNFTSNKALVTKVGLVRTLLTERNGDYSESGVMLIKKHFIGKTVMLFKTWQSALYATTWQDRQIDLALGQVKGGFISDTLSSKRAMKYGIQAMMQSSLAGIAMTASATTVFSSLSMGAGVFAILSAIVVGRALSKGLYKTPEGAEKTSIPSSLWKSVKYAWSNNLGTMVELLVTTFSNRAYVHTGKGFTSLNIDFTMGGELTREEAEALRTFQRMAAMKTYTALMTLMVLSLIGGDDDDEVEESMTDPKARDAQKERWKDKNTALSTGLRNVLKRQHNEIGFTENPLNVFDQYSGKNASLGRVGQKYGALTNLAVGSMFSDSETSDIYMRKGFYYGKSKFEKHMRGYLPKPIANVGIDGYMFGLETFTEKVYEPTLIDESFNTDFKVDKKNATGKRSLLRDKLWKEALQERGLPNKNYLKTKEEKRLKKEIDAEVNRQIPIPSRKSYTDLTQERKKEE